MTGFADVSALDDFNYIPDILEICMGLHWASISRIITFQMSVPDIYHGPLTRYVTLRVAHVPRMPGPVFPPPQVSNPDMQHDTCVTHVPWCMPGSLARSPLKSMRGENVPNIPSACATPNFTKARADPNLVVVVHANVLPHNGAMSSACMLLIKKLNKCTSAVNDPVHL